MSDLMTFPETWEEFERSYGFYDTDEVYTNGSRDIIAWMPLPEPWKGGEE